MASSSLVPRIIVLALGAGALGFPDALRVLLDIAGRSPLTDMAICVFAMAIVTAQVLGVMLLARFVRKAARSGGVTHAHGLAPTTPPRTDRFATLTLVVSLAVVFLVSATLLVASGIGGLVYLVLADVARKMKSSVIAVLVIGAAAVLPCARTLLRVFRREEDHSYGPTVAAAGGSSSASMGHFVNVAQVASFTGAAAFVLAMSGGLYIQRGPLVDMSVGGVAAVVGTVLLAGFTFTRRARNAAAVGGRAAPPHAADTRGFDGKLARLTPYLYLAVVSFAVICLVLASLTAPRTHD